MSIPPPPCVRADQGRSPGEAQRNPGTAVRRRRWTLPAAIARLALASLLPGIAACDQPLMEEQPKYEPYEEAPDWPDQQSARKPVPGTVARGQPVEGRPDEMPLELSRDLLERGRERFEIFCTPCHARTGRGGGMIVERGFPDPPSLHSERLRNAPLRHFYDVITDGYGVMYSYADRVRGDDRWAVAAYIRALQLSQRASPDDLTPEQRSRLEEGEQ